MNESIAMVTAGAEILTNQSGKVARGIRTTGANFVKMAQGAKELKIQVDGNIESVKLWNDEGTDILSTYKILEQIAGYWDDMSDAEKSAIALQISGKNQMDVSLSVLSNFASAQRAYTTALNASGSATKENEAYMESLSAKLSNMHTQFSNLVLGDGGINSFIKGIVDAGTAVLKFANSDLGQLTLATTATVAGIKTLSTALEAISQAQKLKMAVDIASAEASLPLASLGTQLLGFGKIALIIGGVVAVLYTLDKVYKTLNPSIKDVNKSVEDSKKAFEDAEKQADSLKGSLKSVRDEIEKIQSKGKLEITDQEQLDLLKNQETSLRNQLILAQQQKEVAEETFKKEVEATKNKQYSITRYTGKKQSIEDFAKSKGFDQTDANEYAIALQTLSEKYPSGYVPINVTESKNATQALNSLSQSLRQIKADVQSNNAQIEENDRILAENTNLTAEEKNKLEQSNISLANSNKELFKEQQRVIEQGTEFSTANENLVKAGLDDTNKQAQHSIDTWKEVTSTLVTTSGASEHLGATVQDTNQILGENIAQADEDAEANEALNESLNNVSKAMKPIEKAQKEFAKSGNISSSTIANIQSKAKKLNLDFTELLGTMTRTGATTQDINNAFEEMQQQIISNSGVLDNLTDANVDYVGTLLEEMGVVDGTKKAHAELEAQKLLNKEATEGLESVTVNEIAQLLKEETATNSTKIALLNLYYAKLQANSTTVMTDGDIQNLLDLANAAGMAATAVANAKSAISSANASNNYRGYDASGHQLSDIEMDEAAYMMNAIKTGKYTPNQWTWTPIEFKGGTATNSSGGGGAGGSKGGSGGTAKDPVEEAKKQAEEFKKLHKQILDDRLKYLDHELKQEVISVEEHNQLKQRAYGQYFSALSSMGIDYSQEQNEFFDEQREWLQKRFEDSIKYEQHLIDRQIKALQKQKDEESDDYDDQIERLEEKRDKIVDALDEEIDLREEQKDAELDAIKEEQDAIKKKHDEVIDNLKAQIDILKEEKSANKEAWDERIAQLDAVNDELEKQKQLEEKLEALAKARATRVKVFKNGRFVYDVDREAVSEAQKNLNEYKEKLRQERAKKSLQDQRDAEQKNYEERIDALEKYKDQQDKYYDEIEKRLDDNYDAVEKKYKDLLDALKKQRDSEKKLYDDKIKNLQKLKKEQEKEYQDMIDDLNDLKDSYSDALEDMENVQNGFLDATKAFTYDYSKSMEENLKAFMEYVTGVKDGYKELEQAEKQANASSSGSSSSSGGKDYKDISQFSDPSEQHKAWEEAGSPSSSSYSVPDGHGGSTSSLADKYGGIVTSKYSTSHANGVASIGSDELAIVGENPNKEIVVGSRVNNGTLMSLNRGTGVINAKSTRTLAGLVNSIGGSNNLIDRNTSVVQTFSFDKIVLPNVTNANSFVEALSREFNNRAIQYGNIRR